MRAEQLPPERLGAWPGSSAMNVRAPAKVDLCLRLGPLRRDGYHRLTTLVQAIDGYDELELSGRPRRPSKGLRTTRSWRPPSPRSARPGGCG